MPRWINPMGLFFKWYVQTIVCSFLKIFDLFFEKRAIYILFYLLY